MTCEKVKKGTLVFVKERERVIHRLEGWDQAHNTPSERLETASDCATKHGGEVDESWFCEKTTRETRLE